MPKKEIVAEIVEKPAPFAPTPANRARASQLRAAIRRGAIPTAADAAWLADYDAERDRVAEGRGSRGASRGRRVSYTEEETEAVGEGSSAVAEMAAAAATSREEGRRLDSLITVGITALREAADMYKSMTSALLERNRDLEAAHVSMVRASSREYLARIEAEGEIARLEKEADPDGKKDGIERLAEQLLPFLMPALGIKMPGLDLPDVAKTGK